MKAAFVRMALAIVGRSLRTPLAQASAVAIHRGRVFVHPARFAEVAERVAISNFAHGGGGC